MKNEESEAFNQALKDDADAIALIAKAIVSLTQFYKNDKIPLELVQHKKEPEYSVDQDEAPDTTWSGGDYGGRKGESGGIIAILVATQSHAFKCPRQNSHRRCRHRCWPA